MASRIELQKVLEDILGSKNVYFQPPCEMKYPCIKYSYLKPDVKKANDKMYLMTTHYELIVISKTPDNPAIRKLMELPTASYDRTYKSDNLYHDVITLYF